jgi:hypothetical protein
MRKHWSLPNEDALKFSGKDWLQILLSQLDNLTRSRTLMVLWRAWHLRCDIIHEQGKETIASSISFLLSYDLDHTTTCMQPTDGKGKGSLVQGKDQVNWQTMASTVHVPLWTAPSAGWIKINTDTSFIVKDGQVVLVLLPATAKGRSSSRPATRSCSAGMWRRVKLRLPSWESSCWRALSTIKSSGK